MQPSLTPEGPAEGTAISVSENLIAAGSIGDFDAGAGHFTYRICADTNLGDAMTPCECGALRPANREHGYRATETR